MVQRLFSKAIVGAAAIALLGAANASAEETTVRFEVAGQEVVGTLETAEGADNAPIVLMLHGFTGSRDELAVKDTDEGVFSRIARQFSENGFNSLRIDFRGSGESDGEWAATTFSSQIADASAAIDWIKSQDQFMDSKLVVLGWSQGGLVASHAVQENEMVDAVVLLAPVTHPMLTYGGLLGSEAIQKALASPADTPITTQLPWGVETTLNAAFYHEVATTFPTAAISGYTGPLLVVMGDRDEVIAPQPYPGKAWMNYHHGDEALIILDTDHVWSAMEGPALIDEQLMPEITAWLGTALAAE
ncbi:alpha/beta hydrolase [Pseudovibrio exalbescens]|uniref:alpha/beta hydrolase family protein n=1 Tax=Pseudovibrio exalbescens TaxID=197461 RepID=UPI00236578AA|nr:alpha/beta hydrolase [Pseudovibrio exalbescens]MDD7909703.1 alpha/beta hydrolase [Pseudovibrio exalbescens]